MAKSKHIGKFYKTGHNSVTEYWPYWARETVEGIVLNYANKSSKLTQELNQRLAIQNLWPEAFDRGKAKSQWIGRLRMQTDDPLDALEKFIIINGAGEKRVFDAETALNAGVSPPNFYI